MYKLIFPKGAKPHTKSVGGGGAGGAPPPGSANAHWSPATICQVNLKVKLL